MTPQLATTAERNRHLAEQINADVRRDPTSPYAGRFVGIAGGQVICVDTDPRIVLQRLEQVEREAELRLCFEAGLEYDSADVILGNG